MQIDLESVINEYVRRRSGDESPRCEVRSADPWRLDVWFSLADGGAYRIRSLQPSDGFAIHEFGSQLGPRSKWLFCPYAWADRALLDEDPISRGVRRGDLFVLEDLRSACLMDANPFHGWSPRLRRRSSDTRPVRIRCGATGRAQAPAPNSCGRTQGCGQASGFFSWI